MTSNNKRSIDELSVLSIRALRQSHHDQAVEISEEILEQEPDHAGAHAVRFSSLFKSKNFEQARRFGGRAAQLNPTSVFILNNQACLQLEAKQPASAAGLLKSLIDQFGERAQWLYNLALAQRMVGNYNYAITKFRRTLDFQPDHDRAAFQLADCLQKVGRHEEALQAYAYVRLLRSKHAPTHSNFIRAAVANNSLSKSDLSQELVLWQDRFIPKDKRYTVDQPSNALTMKVGFLIGVIPHRWLVSMVAPLINEMAKSDDEITIYWHGERKIIREFDSQINIVDSAGLSDADFARQVRIDEIDVMIDVCGMRLGSRQRVLGLHLAARQFGWLAHEGRYATPLVAVLDDKLDAQRFFVEPRQSTAKPVSKDTMVGINTQRGLAYEVTKTWAYILCQLPNWKLHLDTQAEDIISLLQHQFSELGVTEDRLIFDTSLAATERTIVLDNFVENDPVTASYALEAGGILVALNGPLFPAQQNAALLAQVEKADWICQSVPDYVKRAISLADGAPAEPLDKDQIDMSRIRNIQTFATHFRHTISS